MVIAIVIITVIINIVNKFRYILKAKIVKSFKTTNVFDTEVVLLSLDTYRCYYH